MVKPEKYSWISFFKKLQEDFQEKNFLSTQKTSARMQRYWNKRVILRNLTNNAAGFFSEKVYFIFQTLSRECFWYEL